MHSPRQGLVAIYRRFENEPDRFIFCEGQTLIEPGDEGASSVGARAAIGAVGAAPYDQADHGEVERIMIAGGGRRVTATFL